MVGVGAPEDFVQNLEQLANTHHEELSLDQIRAYHFGQRFIVEMEVVLPAQMTVRESHDIALILQHKVGFQANLLSTSGASIPRPRLCGTALENCLYDDHILL